MVIAASTARNAAVRIMIVMGSILVAARRPTAMRQMACSISVLDGVDAEHFLGMGFPESVAALDEKRDWNHEGNETQQGDLYRFPKCVGVHWNDLLIASITRP
jgi:hypothetical protein